MSGGWPEQDRTSQVRCQGCGADKLKVFFTSRKDGTVLCLACYEKRTHEHLVRLKAAPKRQKELRNADRH